LPSDVAHHAAANVDAAAVMPKTGQAAEDGGIVHGLARHDRQKRRGDDVAEPECAIADHESSRVETEAARLAAAGSRWRGRDPIAEEPPDERRDRQR
jgi:hypothetical protein